MKIGCLNNISQIGLNMFTSNYQVVEDTKNCDLVLVRSFNMHEYDINKNLLAVARAGAGVNNIPLDKMADSGVVAFNTPGANSNGVKELVLAGMFLASRDVIGGVNWVKNNLDDENILKSIEKAKKAFGGTEIFGKTLSVIGLGEVGGKVANACLDLGMKVYGYDPYISEKALKALKPGIEISNNLDMLYKESDFISLHLPLLDTTKHMFNEEVFAKLKPGLILLNYSRDQLVKNEDIKAALEAKIVAKYVTDFPNHFIANLDNVIPIPHLGASTKESEDNCAIMAAKQLMIYVERGDIINSVNFPNVVLGELNGVNRLVILGKMNDNLTNEIDKALKPMEKNIVTSVSKVRKNYVVYSYDLNQKISNDIINSINDIEGVLKTRII
ncbi:3-phosphoglycerate dehydrogenase [Mycoplasmatota bacterium WC30]